MKHCVNCKPYKVIARCVSLSEDVSILLKAVYSSYDNRCIDILLYHNCREHLISNCRCPERSIEDVLADFIIDGDWSYIEELTGIVDFVLEDFQISCAV